ncbi:hypothetical protein DM01DRAFT_1069521 [Hesseltinella vesiculosa]|uniref:Uncharacterized protein n=1 Tax=Hesseltinella vesiculosa TaxID=101127 RepID=A0A1X2GVA6_9FUNG|nr:hypothetical protein DM01DRAFT_1069521 [Hesseltinella vesiculosa]
MRGVWLLLLLLLLRGNTIGVTLLVMRHRRHLLARVRLLRIAGMANRNRLSSHRGRHGSFLLGRGHMLFSASLVLRAFTTSIFFLKVRTHMVNFFLYDDTQPFFFLFFHCPPQLPKSIFSSKEKASPKMGSCSFLNKLTKAPP